MAGAANTACPRCQSPETVSAPGCSLWARACLRCRALFFPAPVAAGYLTCAVALAMLGAYGLVLLCGWWPEFMQRPGPAGEYLFHVILKAAPGMFAGVLLAQGVKWARTPARLHPRIISAIVLHSSPASGHATSRRDAWRRHLSNTGLRGSRLSRLVLEPGSLLASYLLSLLSVGATLCLIFVLCLVIVLNLQGGFICLMLAAALGLPLARYTIKGHLFAKRMRARTGIQVLGRDARPPVLFLRVFDDDALNTNSVSVLPWDETVAFEQVITRTLRRLGPVVAVAPPTQLYPPLGAARVWLREGSWQAAVDELAAQAQLIVAVLGNVKCHPGFEWELRYLFARANREKILLIIPPESLGAIENQWDAYQALSGHKLPAFDAGILAIKFGGRSPAGKQEPNGETYSLAVSRYEPRLSQDYLAAIVCK